MQVRLGFEERDCTSLKLHLERPQLGEISPTQVQGLHITRRWLHHVVFLALHIRRWSSGLRAANSTRLKSCCNHGRYIRVQIRGPVILQIAMKLDKAYNRVIQFHT